MSLVIHFLLFFLFFSYIMQHGEFRIDASLLTNPIAIAQYQAMVRNRTGESFLEAAHRGPSAIVQHVLSADPRIRHQHPLAIASVGPATTLQARRQQQVQQRYNPITTRTPSSTPARPSPPSPLPPQPKQPVAKRAASPPPTKAEKKLSDELYNAVQRIPDYSSSDDDHSCEIDEICDAALRTGMGVQRYSTPSNSNKRKGKGKGKSSK